MGRRRRRRRRMKIGREDEEGEGASMSTHDLEKVVGGEMRREKKKSWEE